MTHVTISLDPVNFQNRKKVEAIKALRYVSGMGLKEAKEVIDSVCSNGYHVMGIASSPEKLKEFQAALVATGFKTSFTGSITDFPELYGNALRSLASQAVLSGHDDLADKLIAIIRSYDDRG